MVEYAAADARIGIDLLACILSEAHTPSQTAQLPWTLHSPEERVSIALLDETEEIQPGTRDAHTLTNPATSEAGGALLSVSPWILPCWG
jgi:hypothetical protein